MSNAMERYEKFDQSWKRFKNDILKMKLCEHVHKKRCKSKIWKLPKPKWPRLIWPRWIWQILLIIIHKLILIILIHKLLLIKINCYEFIINSLLDWEIVLVLHEYMKIQIIIWQLSTHKNLLKVIYL